MTDITKWALAVALAVLIPTAVLAQESKIAAVDFERMVVGSAAGTKAAEQWNAKYAEHQKNLEARQAEIQTQQTRLTSQANILSETAKADIARDIERKTTDLNRLSEDAQKEMEDLRAQLLQPISAVAQQVLQAYSTQQGYTMVIDVSNPESNIVYVNKAADITDAVIAEINKVPAAAPAAAAPAPARAPTTPAPAPEQ